MKKLFVLALGLSVALASCSKTAEPGATLAGGRVNAFTIPHVLRYATAEDVGNLNPHLSQQSTLQLMSSLTMAWLTKWDTKNQVYPELATIVPTQANGGVSKDGLTITYHLRHGVRWSDGAPFDADDVVFSTQVVLNPANNEVGRTGWDRITKVEEPDKYTVIYHLSKPYSPFVETFFSSQGGNPCILPKHLLAQYPNINNVAYNSLPVGIGPFKYKEWDRQQQVVMVANPTYFRGLPKLKEIDFKIIPDRNTILSQLEAKELDLWYPAAAAYYERVKALTPFNVWTIPGYAYNHYDFNMTRPKDRDPVVRRALRLAFDRATILRKLAHGLGQIQEVTTASTSPYFTAGIPNVPYDPAQANAMLDKDGWVRGPDGIRAKNGVKLDLDVATSTGTPDVDEQLELVREDWKQIGVGMNIRHYPSPQLFNPQGGIIFGNTWDIVSFAWVSDAIGDMSSEYSCADFPPNGQNDLRWCNPKAEVAMQAFYAHYDQPQRNKDVAVFERELVNDTPTIVYEMRDDIWVVNKDLKGFTPNSITPFDNIMNADI